MNLLDTKQAAKRIGKSRRWIQALIKKDRLPAVKMGRDFFIDPADLADIRNLQPGRPAEIK